MENRVYYGEYSLRHWIDLVLKKNIVLPDYQRYFVWDEKKVETLIETFKNKQGSKGYAYYCCGANKDRSAA